MSSSSVSSSTSSTSSSGYMLSSLGSGSSQQITGLASGLNTDQIITEEMSIYQQPVTNLQNQQNGQKAQVKALTSIQSELQALETDAQALSDPSLFANTQTVTSSDPTRVAASSTTGAGVGGYEVSVTQLANSAQQTFSYSSANADTITFDGGQQVPITSGESVSDFVKAVNANSNIDVYAAATDSGTVVFSSRTTGSNATFSINDGNPTSPALTAQGAMVPGQDALWTVGTTSGSSHTNTVSNAIPGVTLSLTGVTTTSGPVTVNVAPPAPSATNVQNAVNTFMTQYNKVISDVQTQLTTAPSSTDPTVGTLYGDPSLQGLLSSMRSMMYTGVAGGSSSIQSMLDVGVSTGSTTGSGAVSTSALAGTLQLNATTLASALQSNPSGVQQMMVAFGSQFSTLVGGEADPGGTIDARINGDDSMVTQLGNQITAMQATLADKQQSLVNEFAQLEAALSSNQSQASWLTSQVAALPGA